MTQYLWPLSSGYTIFLVVRGQSMGSLGVKFSFSPKMHQVLQLLRSIDVLHVSESAFDPLYRESYQSGVEIQSRQDHRCDGQQGSKVLLSFFLATRLFHILLYIRFRPNLVKVTSTLTTTQAQMMMGSEVTMGSLGSKRSFSPKRHQVLQNA